MRLVLSLAALWLAGCSTDPRPVQSAKPSAAAAPVKILQFYASPGAVERGDQVTLCYGVENAASVRLDPAVAQIDPSPNRCVQFTPERTRSYTLVAAGGAGQPEAKQSLEIRVEPRTSARQRPTESSPEGSMIQTFTASSERTAAGQPVTLCYIVHGADSVQLDPAPAPVALSERACISVRPLRTQTYTLTAKGKGRTEHHRVTIRVK